MNTQKLIIPVLLAVLTAAAGGQTAHVYFSDPFPPTDIVTNTVLATSPCGLLVPQAPVNPAFTPLGLGIVPPTPFGGDAFDQFEDREYVSDGPSIRFFFHPLYAPGADPCGATRVLCPGEGLVHLYPHPGGFGNITGMCFRQALNSSCPATLYVTDGTLIMGLTPCPPFAVVCGPFPVPATKWGAPLTGLECESVLGVIVACDFDGWSYVFSDPCGCSSLVFPPIVLPPHPSLVQGPFSGNAIIGNVLDRSVAGYEYWITNGASLWRVFPFLLAPLAVPPVPPGSIPRGASFSAEPVVLPACTSPYSALTIGTTEPAVIGPPFKNQIVWLTGAPPSAPAYLGISFSCWTVGPTDCAACVFHLDLLTMYLVATSTTASGDACVNFGPILPSLLHSTLYAQWVVLDSSCGPPSFVVSDALHGRVSTL